MLPEQGARGELLKLEQEAPVHSQVRKIKQEDEKARELLHRLQLPETRPSVTDFRELSPRVSPSSSPLRRAGQAISVGD